MITFFMFGKYSQESLKRISPQRTRKVYETIQRLGGRVKSAYALLGQSDLIFIVSLPDEGKATLASIELTKMTGISFSTSTAIPVEQFDQLINEYK